jgi:hypothetical protein
VPIRAATFAAHETGIEVGTNSEDAVTAGLALMAHSARAASVRLVRRGITAADSAWARGRDHVLLNWPASDTSARWPRRLTIDAIGGVATNAVLVGRFPRLWMLTGHAIAHWADGETAAVEHETGDGCIRDVGVLIDDASDITLSGAFRRFAEPLLAPCGGMRDLTSIDSAMRASLAGAGSLAPAVAVRERSTESSRWSPWLFALAAALLIAELAVRRKVRSGA